MRGKRKGKVFGQKREKKLGKGRGRCKGGETAREVKADRPRRKCKRTKGWSVGRKKGGCRERGGPTKSADRKLQSLSSMRWLKKQTESAGRRKGKLNVGQEKQASTASREEGKDREEAKKEKGKEKKKNRGRLALKRGTSREKSQR